MKYDYSKLLGKIIEVFGSQYIFAREMRWSERTTSLKLNGHREWKQTEIDRACILLNINEKYIPDYFFTAKVQN